MSGFTIQGGATARMAALEQANAPASAQSSRDLLTGYRAHLTTPSGVKKGVVHILKKGSGDKLVRDRWFNWHSRKNADVSQAANLLKASFADAYKDKVSPQKFAALTSALEQYLENRGNQLGTKTFVKLVDAFESATKEHGASVAAGGRALDAETTSLLSGKEASKALEGLKAFVKQRPQPRNRAHDDMDDPNFTFSKPDQQAVARHRLEGLTRALDWNPSEIRALIPGAASHAYMVGDAVVTAPKTNTLPTLNLKSLGKGEAAAAVAAKSSQMPHVAKPTAFIVLVSQIPVNSQISNRSGNGKAVSLTGTDAQAFEVPADKLRGFLQTQPEGTVVEQLAIKMPAGAATNIQEAVNQAPLNAKEFPQLAAGLYQGLREMHGAGLLHHDIKPANATFDRESGKVMLVDLGSTVALNAQGWTEVHTPMTPLFTSSSLQNPPIVNPLTEERTMAQHGVETDRYAMAITLMNGLAPSLALSNQSVTTAFGNAANQIQGAVANRQDVVKIYLDTLEDLAKKEPAFADIDVQGKSEDEAKRLQSQAAPARSALQELTESFDRIDGARLILETALRAGLSGTEGEAAWESLAVLLQDPLNALAAQPLPATDVQAPNVQAAFDQPVNMLEASLLEQLEIAPEDLKRVQSQPLADADSPQSQSPTFMEAFKQPSALPEDAYDLGRDDGRSNSFSA